jgi:uncharacterized protein YecT (DUF1311 family)
MRIRHHVASLLILSACGIGTGEAPSTQKNRTPQDDDPYRTCLDDAETNSAFSDCGTIALARQESRLAAVWDSVIIVLQRDSALVPEDTVDSNRRRQALLDEQRAWIRYSDLACRYWLEGAGREGVVLHYPLCKVGVIAHREEDLRQTFLEQR